jgi:PPM family protein phosphatase
MLVIIMEKGPQAPGSNIEKLSYRFGAHTEKGDDYDINHDANFFDLEHGAAGAFDGVGNSERGATASQTASEAIKKSIAEPSNVPLKTRAIELVKIGNNAVREKRDKDSDLQGMSTTATVLLLKEKEGALASVGDTRAYLIKNGSYIGQITKDDVLDREEIEKAWSFMKKKLENVITNSLGHEDFEKEFTDEAEKGIGHHAVDFKVEQDDIFLIVSDGIYKVLPDNDLREIVSTANSPQEAAEELVFEAQKAEKEKGTYSDDKTAVVIFAR